jgi:basic membrane lipoprotein Med (substrate-binding protein (PBP1-ABC) superfamily)
VNRRSYRGVLNKIGPPSLRGKLVPVLVAAGGALLLSLTATTATASATTFNKKVGVVLYGAANEPGYYAGMASGAKTGAAATKAKLTLVDNVNGSLQQQVAAINALAQAGNSLIVVDSTDVDAAVASAAENPNSVYDIFQAPIPSGATSNVRALVPHSTYLSYVEGVLAAHLTKSKKVAFIEGAPDVPGNVNSKAFALGAKSVSPAPAETTSIVGNYSDPVAAKQTLSALVGDNVDVVSAFGDGSWPGFFQAVKGTKTLLFTPVINRCSLSPNVVGNAIQGIPSQVSSIITDFAAGTLPKGNEYVGLKNPSELSLQLCKAYNTSANQAIVNKTVAALNSGKIVIPTSITSAG